MAPSDATDILPATTVKRHFLDLLKRIGKDRPLITITRNGVPAGVLMGVEEYESLLETIEILAEPKVARALKRARGNFARRRTLTHEQVWRDA